MEDQLVTYGTAVKAKARGFREITSTVFHHGTRKEQSCLGMMNWNGLDKGHKFISRPTQTLLARWLRVKHGLHIVIEPSDNLNYYLMTIRRTDRSLVIESREYGTYEVALEIGLQQAMTYIKIK